MHPSVTLRRLAPLAALLGLTACAAALEQSRRIPATLSADSLTPGRPAATHLGPDATRTCPTAGVGRELAGKVAKLAEDRGEPAAVADGRLCAVAEALLSWPSDNLPSEGIRTFLSQYFGLLQSPQGMVLTTMPSEDSRDIGEGLAATVAKFSGTATQPRYGFATERQGAKKTRVVLVLLNENIALDPLPRRLAPGEKATFAGKVLGDLENPKVLVSDVAGRLTEAPTAPGPAFKAELACGERPGTIWVELRAEEMGNERVMSTLGVPCGQPLPTSVLLAPPAWPADVAAQEAKVAQLINAERTGAGLPALQPLEPVSRIARALAEAVRDGAKKGAPVVPVDVVKRLGEADINAPVILQNPAAASSAEQAYGRLASSPTHRASAMSTDVDHLGVGVAVGTDASGKSVTYLMELFIKVQPPPDVAASRKTIREAIDKKRAAEKLPALTSDATLEKAASDFAAVVAAAGGPPPKAKTEEFTKSINKVYKDIVFVVDARLDLDDYAEDPNALAKGKLVGLGGALGRHPRLGNNTLFVVLIIANKR